MVRQAHHEYFQVIGRNANFAAYQNLPFVLESCVVGLGSPPSTRSFWLVAGGIGRACGKDCFVSHRASCTDGVVLKMRSNEVEHTPPVYFRKNRDSPLRGQSLLTINLRLREAR